MNWMINYLKLMMLFLQTVASVVAQHMVTHNIIIDIDATAKVNQYHDTLSIVSMEPSDDFVSDEEFECDDNDNDVIVKSKDVLAPYTSTDLVVYNPKLNDHDLSMRAVYPIFYTVLMRSEKTHKDIEAEFLRADWVIPKLFDELYHSTPALMQSVSNCNK